MNNCEIKKLDGGDEDIDIVLLLRMNGVVQQIRFYKGNRVGGRVSLRYK